MAGAKHFKELIVWQLGDRHRAEVFALTGRTRLRTDLKLRAQIDDAADSVCRNIAEGFGCQSHREFAKFLRISRRSMNEVQDGFRSASLKGYVTEADLEAATILQRRFYKAMAGFLRYLVERNE